MGRSKPTVAPAVDAVFVTRVMMERTLVPNYDVPVHYWRLTGDISGKVLSGELRRIVWRYPEFVPCKRLEMPRKPSSRHERNKLVRGEMALFIAERGVADLDGVVSSRRPGEAFRHRDGNRGVVCGAGGVKWIFDMPQPRCVVSDTVEIDVDSPYRIVRMGGKLCSPVSSARSLPSRAVMTPSSRKVYS